LSYSAFENARFDWTKASMERVSSKTQKQKFKAIHIPEEFCIERDKLKFATLKNSKILLNTCICFFYTPFGVI
jgi:hypothetical protein